MSADPTAEALRVSSTRRKGRGVAVSRPFQVGEVVLEFIGPRQRTDEVEDFARVIQVAPDLFIGPSGEIDDLVNHACNPNCGIREENGRLFLVALRPVAAGDEVTFDYSTCMLDEPWRLTCRCGSRRCRGVILPYRELNEELRRHYAELGVVPAFVLQSVG